MPAKGKVDKLMSSMLSKSEFDLLRVHIQQISGIVLDDSKMMLMESRLSPLVERFQCASYTDLYVKAQCVDDINIEICNAISTNETSFFRDQNIFQMIGDDFVPHFLNRTNSIHVWSAASSTGQEAYSVAMTLQETIPNIGKYDVSIEGTDISNEAIAYASYGLYTSFELQRGIDATRQEKYFDPHEKGYRIKDQLRYMAHFQELNLLKHIPFGAQFDLILCRNIAIYFDKPTKKMLFERLARCLKPRGRLIVGSTETLWQVTDVLQRRDSDGVVFYSLEESDD